MSLFAKWLKLRALRRIDLHVQRQMLGKLLSIREQGRIQDFRIGEIVNERRAGGGIGGSRGGA